MRTQPKNIVYKYIVASMCAEKKSEKRRGESVLDWQKRFKLGKSESDEHLRNWCLLIALAVPDFYSHQQLPHV